MTNGWILTDEQTLRLQAIIVEGVDTTSETETRGSWAGEK